MKIFNLVIMKKEDYDFKLAEHFVDGYSACHNFEEKFKKTQDKIIWSTLRPVVYSLKELRNNTWDTDRVDRAIKFLTDNFEVKDDRTSNTSTNEDCE